MKVDERARIYAALGDPVRLRIVDELLLSDRSFQDLAGLVGLPGNAAAHHLGVLEAAGLLTRRVSEGDRRRRYIGLKHELLDGIVATRIPAPMTVLFVCTHNSARSQFAEALWRQRTGGAAMSAGTQPAAAVHGGAVRAAAEFGVDLHGVTPRGYDAVQDAPDLIVSVCDRAREAGLPFSRPSLHWSVPDPVPSATASAFRAAFADLAGRVGRLAAATEH